MLLTLYLSQCVLAIWYLIVHRDMQELRREGIGVASYVSRYLKIPGRDELRRLPEVNILYRACARELSNHLSAHSRPQTFRFLDRARRELFSPSVMRKREELWSRECSLPSSSRRGRHFACPAVVSKTWVFWSCFASTNVPIDLIFSYLDKNVFKVHIFHDCSV